jgi:hypothetical protein
LIALAFPVLSFLRLCAIWRALREFVRRPASAVSFQFALHSSGTRSATS